MAPAALRCSAPPAGAVLKLVGESGPHFGGSLWAEHRSAAGAIVRGEVPPPIDDPLTRYEAVHQAIVSGAVLAAHDCSEGGLAVTLAEMAIAGRVGIDVAGEATAAWLFGESNGRIVLAVDPSRVDDAPGVVIGATDDSGRFRLGAAGIDLAVSELVAAWKG